MNCRVVITGLGAVTPIGHGAGTFFDALGAGAVGVRRIEAFDPGGFPCQIAAEVDGYSVRDHLPQSYRKAVKVMSRESQLAVGTAHLAIQDAGLKTAMCSQAGAEVDLARFAVHIATGTPCTDLPELAEAAWYSTEDGKFSLARWGREGMMRLPPLWLLQSLPNMLSSHVAIIHGTRGPSNTIMCGTAGGHLAVLESVRVIQRGDASVGLAGGVESQINLLGMLRQCFLKRVTTSRNNDPAGSSRPFDQDRDGMVVGEGGGLVVLEEEMLARRRNARVYAEILGCAATSSAYSVRHPEPDGRAIAQAIRKALAEAKLVPSDIDLIVPHGTGIRDHDVSESKAIHAALGPSAGQTPVWPIMSQIGNTGAAAGSLGLIAAVMAMQQGRVPAAVNCPRPDEACGLAIVQRPLPRPPRTALVCSYSLGVQNAALVVRRVD